MMFKIFVLVLSLIAASACSTFDEAYRADLEARSIALSEQQAKTIELSQIVDELRAENTRLQETLEDLRAEKTVVDKRLALAATAEEARDGDAVDDVPDDVPIELTIPAPPKNADAVIVAGAEAAPLSSSAVTVESTPRLVEPSFVAVDDVFENEASSANIETTSVLFGVHLSSYRDVDGAIIGWKDLQRDNPDQLGLLEPRIETVVIEGRGAYQRLIAGGFSSIDKASDLCRTLEKKNLYCSVMEFSGERLTIPASVRSDDSDAAAREISGSRKADGLVQRPDPATPASGS